MEPYKFTPCRIDLHGRCAGTKKNGDCCVCVCHSELDDPSDEVEAEGERRDDEARREEF